MVESKQIEKALFDAALNLSDPAARQAFLEQVCAGNRSLRTRLEQLLAAQTPAEEFFAAAAAFRMSTASNGGDGTTITSAREPTHDNGSVLMEVPGMRIGRYKLLQRIGEGGCGVVYMAEQEEPVRRRVALKIIRLGMDTENVIARFEAERQALAMMDHPNIARVFDAGATETGRPYFVMELVRGVKITDYCDQNHLATRQRLDLFIQICHAIQHAHQKGLIHRDIKPSNILITLHDGVPVPKVIDFGIAKATEGRLTERTLFTAYEQLIGTPAYMSPEQAEMSGLDVDTRTDIYSLGVMLYELLTGRTPFDPKQLVQSGLEEMRRTLREREPQRPSTMLTTLQAEELTATAVHRQSEPPRLISLVSGDLDWIVMRALEKDRRRRYETANGFAMDIERYLNNEPVNARPPSRLYRFQKLVQRNRVVFAAGGAVALALIFGLGTCTWLLLKEREVRRQAVDAEQREAQLRHQAETREKISQAALFISQGRFGEADSVIEQVSLTHPTLEGAAVFRSLGEWHALGGRWKQAADHFAVVLELHQLDGPDSVTLDYLEYGPSLIESGDLGGYERFRQGAVLRYAGSESPFADRIIKVSLLTPADEKLLQSLKPLADIARNSLTAKDRPGDRDIFQAAWQSVSLALVEYRKGNYAGAAEWCRRCLAYPEHNAPRTATARIILAMSSQQLGQMEEAHNELTDALEIVGAKFKSKLERGTGVQGFWFDWVFARILLREATGLVEGPRLQAESPSKSG